MPAPAFRAAGTQGTDSGGNPVVPYPAGVVAGDVLFIQFICGSSCVPTTPSGWTKLFGPTALSGVSVLAYMYYRIAGASEPSSVTFSHSGGGYAAGVMSAYSGSNGAIDVSSTAVLPTSGTAASCPAVTTLNPNDRVLHFVWAFAPSGTTTTPDAADTERYDTTWTDAATQLELADFALATPGSTGTPSIALPGGIAGGLSATIAIVDVAVGSSGVDASTVTLRLTPKPRIYKDDFDRAAGGLGANWTTFTYGSSSVAPQTNGTKFSSASGYASAYFNQGKIGPDAFVSITYGGSGYNWLWLLSNAPAATGYNIMIEANSALYVNRVLNGSSTQLTYVTFTSYPLAGDQFGLVRLGNQLIVYAKRIGETDWAPLLNYTDSTYIGEFNGGLSAYSGTADNFLVQDWTPFPPINYTDAGTYRLNFAVSGTELQSRNYLDAATVLFKHTITTEHECVSQFRPQFTSFSRNKWSGATMSGFIIADPSRHYVGVVSEQPKQDPC